MLLLLTVGLLLIGLVTLVIGFLNSSLALDYISIAASALSFALVLLFTRLGRARAARTASARSQPAPPPLHPTDTGVIDIESEHAREPETRSVSRTGRFPATRTPASTLMDEPPPEEEAERDELDEASWEPEAPAAESWEPEPPAAESWEPEAPAAESWEPEPPVAEPTRVPRGRSPYEPPSSRVTDVSPPREEEYADEGGEEGFTEYEDVEFPIADYDELRVAEIVPLLDELEPDEIEVVRDRELRGRGRAVILDKLDELSGPGAGMARRDAPASPVPNGTRLPQREPVRGGRPDLDYGYERPAYRDRYDEEDEYDEGGQEDRRGPREAEFPIADYDDLRLTEILPLLPQLEPVELELVRQRELAGERRATLLNRIDALIGTGPSRSPARQLR